MMRLRETFTLFWITLLIPLTISGSYFAYTQSRNRVEELNKITPLSETDLEKVVRLAVGLDNTDDLESETPAPPNIAVSSSEEPTLAPLTVVDENDTPTPEPLFGSNEETEAAEQSTPITDQITPQASLDPRRVTVLLLGIDQRQGEEGQFRTDTMIVLTLDPVAKTGAMLSIPRDLWITIPGGFGESRINTANYIGDNPEINFPGGGPALAMLTVEKLIGEPIDHYILVNFDAFTTLVDVVGPIEICVQELIDDPKYPDGSYGYLPIRIEPGCQAMEATRLLQYARTRATSGGDFDRARRQQEVILEVRKKILSTGGISSLLGDALTIWESVSQNIRTDLTLDEIIELGLLAQGIEDIRSDTIGEGEVFAGIANDGSEILIPIQSDILGLVNELFRAQTAPVSSAPTANNPEAAAPQFTIDPNNLPLPVREEAPIIATLNATTVRGRATNLQQYILGYNLDVGFVGNHTSSDVVQTFIMYYGDHQDSANYLAQILAQLTNGAPVPVQQGEGTRPEGDVLIIIGTDLNIPESQ